MVFLNVRGQTPSSGKAPFGVEVDPLDKDTTRYFPLATVAHGNTRLYRSLFSASQDARFLGLAGSETESGQSGLQETNSHKPPHRMRRSLTVIILCLCTCYIPEPMPNCCLDAL